MSCYGGGCADLECKLNIAASAEDETMQPHGCWSVCSSGASLEC
jgi:hypothetical protein